MRRSGLTWSGRGPSPKPPPRSLDEIGSERLVALGGGRVIDTAKAIAAVRGGSVAAVPTTLSGAEMTAIHRLPAGASGASGVRPELVLADPRDDQRAGGPAARLGDERPRARRRLASTRRSPTERSRLDALRGAELIAAALDLAPAERDAGGLALGALSARGRWTSRAWRSTT